MRVTEEQVLWFRARRGHLAGPGAPDAAAAARAILGAQSQQLSMSLLALSQRTAGRPTAVALQRSLLEAPRELVRTWGQRGTVHVYDAADDWALVVAARAEWSPGPRRGVMPSEAMVSRAGKALASADRPLTRRDIEPLVSASYVRALEPQVSEWATDAKRFAAGRLLWHLVLRGEACFANKYGSEQAYAARMNWFPDLSWPDRPSATAATELARRYLQLSGAATPQDLAHFFDARVSTVREWLAALGAELTPVLCGERKGLVALATDLDDLVGASPTRAADWPLRLLPMWDCLLMSHADKSWTVPDEGERKLVWKKAGVVAPVVLDRGRVVATWSHKVQRGRLLVVVEPLSRWRKSRHAAQVNREAVAVARHLGLEQAEVQVVKKEVGP